MIISQVSDIIYTIIIMSLSGSALILLLLALKQLIRHRLPKSVQYFLWLATLLALLIPVSKLISVPEAPSNIILSPIRAIAEQNNFAAEEENLLRHTNAGTEMQTDTAAKPAVDPAPKPAWTAAAVFMIAYLSIALAVLLFNVFSYIRFTKKVRRHRTRARMEELYKYIGLCGDAMAPRLYRSAIATTPMLIGFLKPEIILPDREYSDAQLQNVLMHEITHMRRRDVVVKWLSVITCALHWFNPLVWLARREIDRICELSCDEAVIRKLDQKGKQSYGDTLISVAADTKATRAVLSTTMCEEKEVLKERLDAIMKYQKRTWLTMVLSTVIVIIAVGAVCILGAGAITPSIKGVNNVAALEAASMQSAPPASTPAEDDLTADALKAAAMQSALPSSTPASTPDPEYVKQLRKSGVNVNTVAEFANAMKGAYVIVIKKDMTLSDDTYYLDDINALVIDKGVTLTVNSPNFYAECVIVNLGEIVIEDPGRMVFYHEPDYSCIGKISRTGRDAEICFNAGLATAESIYYYLHEGSLFTSLNIVASSSGNNPVEIRIDHDVTIPAGKRLWLNIYSVLHVPEGVTLTNNGTITGINKPIIEGKIVGIGKKLF